MKNKKELRSSGLLTLTALIWGVAFVAQSAGGDAIGPYSFNCLRSVLAIVILVPTMLLMDRAGISRKPANRQEKKNLWKGGICCGVILFASSNLQQLGLYLGTPAGKAGFLTACYILLVPILGLFLKKKCGFNVWIGVALALVGLYLLCMSGSFMLQLSDLLVLGCALCFSVHILTVDHFSPLVDGVRLSCIQFLTCAVLGLIPTLLLDVPNQGGFALWIGAFQSPDAWVSLLYAGFMSSGVAYTLQIIGQKGINPTVASMLMSLESVFSVLAGWVILHQHLSGRELIGCLLIFAAIMLAQIPVGKKKAIREAMQ